eukprot:3454449-Rhodomonas_salina.1
MSGPDGITRKPRWSAQRLMRRRPMTFVSARSWMRADWGSVFTFRHGTSSGTEVRYAMWSNSGSPEKRP